jgi:hypothetical protein
MKRSFDGCFITGKIFKRGILPGILNQLLFVHIFLEVRIIVRFPFLFTPPKVFVTPEDGMSSLFVPPPIPPKGGL